MNSLESVDMGTHGRPARGGEETALVPSAGFDPKRTRRSVDHQPIVAGTQVVRVQPRADNRRRTVVGFGARERFCRCDGFAILVEQLERHLRVTVKRQVERCGVFAYGDQQHVEASGTVGDAVYVPGRQRMDELLRPVVDAVARVGGEDVATAKLQFGAME